MFSYLRCCAVELLRLVTSDDVVTSLSKKLSASIKIHVVKPTRSLFSQFPKLIVDESVGSRRKLHVVANSVHHADTADADATQQSSWVASAVCISHYRVSTAPVPLVWGV